MSKYVVLLCGTPGCGKSTFASQLQEHMTRHHSEMLRPTTLSYDEVANELVGSLTYKEIRAHTLELLGEMLNSTTNPSNVFIVDDTMHYHSMRREVYARARDLGAAVQNVWLRCDIELAVERDRGRSACLGEEVWINLTWCGFSCSYCYAFLMSLSIITILVLYNKLQTVRKVYNMFETPREENIWERFFLTIDTNSDSRYVVVIAVATIIELGSAIHVISNNTCITTTALLLVLSRCALDPSPRLQSL
jgi:tRNA uridine 5-carbamoylmethylation protein Kti12